MKIRTFFLMLVAIACSMQSFAQNSPEYRYQDSYKPKSPTLTAALSIGSTLLPATAGGLLIGNDHEC